MSTPDPKTVREIAREAVRRGGSDSGYGFIGSVISDHAAMDEMLASGDRAAFGRLHAAVRAELKDATVTVSWPDEQQPADVVTAEQQQDGAVGRDEAAEQAEERYRNTRTHVLVALSEHCSFPHIGLAATAVTALVKPQLEAVYAAGLRTEAERTALAARVAELESERKADVRAVMRCQRAKAGPDAVPAMLALDARFADRIAVLDADTDGGAA